MASEHFSVSASDASVFPPRSPPLSAQNATLHPFPSYRTIAPSGAPFGEGELRPFRCLEPGCFLRFKRKFALAEHTKTHTGEKPFICPVQTCGKAFSTSGNLTRYKYVHPWLKPEVCLVAGCDRSFSNETKLERHLMTHFVGPQTLQPCEVAGCESMFSTTGNLTRHLRQLHPNFQIKRQVRSVDETTTSLKYKYQDGRIMLFDTTKKQASRGFDPLLGEESSVSDEELRAFLDGVFEGNNTTYL